MAKLGKGKSSKGKRKAKAGAQSVTVKSHAQPLARSYQTIRKNPLIKQYKDSITVVNSELVETITANYQSDWATNLCGYAINPGATTFNWLRILAAAWESYQFKKLTFEWVPAAPATANGSVIMAFDYDIYDDDPVDAASMSTWAHATRSTIWTKVSNSLRTRDAGTLSKKRFARTVPVSGGRNLQDYDIANFFIGFTNLANANVVGELWVHYECQLFTPTLHPIMAAGTSTPVSTTSGIYSTTLSMSGRDVSDVGPKLSIQGTDPPNHFLDFWKVNPCLMHNLFEVLGETCSDKFHMTPRLTETSSPMAYLDMSKLTNILMFPNIDLMQSISMLPYALEAFQATKRILTHWNLKLPLDVTPYIYSASQGTSSGVIGWAGGAWSTNIPIGGFVVGETTIMFGLYHWRPTSTSTPIPGCPYLKSSYYQLTDSMYDAINDHQVGANPKQAFCTTGASVGSTPVGTLSLHGDIRCEPGDLILPVFAAYVSGELNIKDVNASFFGLHYRPAWQNLSTGTEFLTVECYPPDIGTTEDLGPVVWGASSSPEIPTIEYREGVFAQTSNMSKIFNTPLLKNLKKSN